MPARTLKPRTPVRHAAVGVRELRQNLSVHLDRVKRGAVLRVTEHGRVVATLQPVSAADARLDRLEAQGLVRRALKPLSEVPPPRRMPATTPDSAAILEDLSADRL